MICGRRGAIGIRGWASAPSPAEAGARRPETITFTLKCLSRQSERVEGPGQAPEQDILACMVQAAQVRHVAFNALEAEASGETQALVALHLTAKRGFAAHGDDVVMGGEIGREQAERTPHAPLRRRAPGKAGAALGNLRQLFIPKVQLGDGVAAPNQRPITERQGTFRGTQGDAENAFTVIGKFMHAGGPPEYLFDATDRRHQ